MRNISFQNDNYYHIYNRGVDKRKIFLDEKDYIRFIIGMREFNNINPIGSLHVSFKELGSFPKEPSSLKLVEIICYCLNPNHYHFILKQKSDEGISRFMHKVSLGYTNYFNFKTNRSGSLFQGKFKAVEINSTDQLIYLSCYINGNPEIHKITKADKYPWSSCLDYLGKRTGTLCDKELILENFESVREYRELLDMVIKESGRRKDEIKKYLLE